MKKSQLAKKKKKAENPTHWGCTVTNPGTGRAAVVAKCWMEEGGAV